MITEAILRINPNAQVTVLNDDYESIIWNNTPVISKADIEAQFPAIEFDIAMEKLRVKRNKFLTETDYFGNSDVTMSDAMTTYRQNLRDITNGLTTKDDVDAVVFPTKPSE